MSDQDAPIAHNTLTLFRIAKETCLPQRFEFVEEMLRLVE